MFELGFNLPTFLIFLFVIGLVAFILGIVILAAPEAVKGLGTIMLVGGLFICLGIGGYWIYTGMSKKKSPISSSPSSTESD
jgi:hypothetical protein